jgi:hypothetical protein
MTMKSKLIAIAAAAIVFASAAWLLLDQNTSLTGGHVRAVDDLVARNVEARGGADAWQAVSSLRMTGQMDLGQGMHVPYTLDRKRPGQMCLEFEFDEQLATQCVAGDGGWRLLPYRGRFVPEIMNASEVKDMADTASIDGLLFNAERRGHQVQLLGHEPIEGRDTIKLEVTFPSGGKRWVYLDAETALEVRVDATRILQGKERLVETYYYDWRETDGLVIPRRQITRTEGMDGSHFLTVETVSVNPPIGDERFRLPVAGNASSSGGSAS